MKKNKKNFRALLINPWVYDFAAFDLWARPIGLLYIASMLREAGIEVDYLDCLDRYHPLVIDHPLKDKAWGTGKYFSEEIKKPQSLTWMKRRYKRYGIPLERVKEYLSSANKPDVILLSTRMTYWYNAVKDMAEVCREFFPDVPLIIGGTYVTLLPQHAKENIPHDFLITGEAEIPLQDLLEDILGIKFNFPNIDFGNLDTYPFPAWDLHNIKKSIVIITSRGCPMACNYCASHIIIKKFRRRSVQNVIDEIQYLYERQNIENIAFYDDALLFYPEDFFKPLLRQINKIGFKNLHFHCPNGISSKDVDQEMADMMKEARFETIPLSLESINVSLLKSLNRKNTPDDFLKAISCFRKAGFTDKQLKVYLLAGLPGQNAEDINEAMRVAVEEGGSPKLAEYSPIPGTALWDDAVKSAKMDIKQEPLLHNCSVFFNILEGFVPENISLLRRKYRKKA